MLDNFGLFLEVKHPIVFYIFLDVCLMDVGLFLKLLLEAFWSKNRSDPETCECKDFI